MKCIALILSAGVVVGGCFACAPLPPAPPPPPPMPFACNAQPFLSKVSVLALPFRPDVYSGYHPPQSNQSISISQNIMTDLGDAFCSAQPSVRQDLLSLDKVFINPCAADEETCGLPNPPVCDPNNCNLTDQQMTGNSWGFRERSDQPPGSGRYIAISAGLWKGGNPASDLASFETAIVQNLLGWSAVAYNSAAPNSSAMTVLAALSHELGHVLWYEVNNPNKVNIYDPDLFCNKQFFKQSWKKVAAQDLRPPKWHQFGQPSTTNLHLPADAGLDEILDAARQRDKPIESKLLDKIFNKHSGRWATLFAAFSPDEDFIETYKFLVLITAQPGLASLVFTKPDGSTIDLVADYPLKGVLHNKKLCFPQFP